MEKRLKNIKKTLLECIQGKAFRSMTEKELINKLDVVKENVALFKKALAQLVKKGDIHLLQGKYHPPRKEKQVIRGVLKAHPRGFGFVTPDPSYGFSEDIFIPKQEMLDAIDQDIVEVVIQKSSKPAKGPEGIISALIERERTHLSGIILRKIAKTKAEAYVPLLGMEKAVVIEHTSSESLKKGDRFVASVRTWGSAKTPCVAQLKRKLKPISDPSGDIEAAIESFELRAQFPQAALQEAKQFGKRVSLNEIKKRVDLRDLETITIDPVTARDFDDALSIEKKRKSIRLYVHIADVSHYVKEGTALDKEALKRANSTYFPDACLPMLPPSLSNHLCSLKPLVNRLAITLVLDFDYEGELIDYQIKRSVIKSNKRFTYREAFAVLEGNKRSKYKQTLKELRELTYLLKKKRYKRGSIEFALSETRVLVNKKGVPTGTELLAYDISHQMVEEFMIKANETIAKHLNELASCSIYRVHDEPLADNMSDFASLAHQFGYSLPNTPTAKELQALFEKVRDTACEHYLSISYIKRMRMAQYATETSAHFGLALSHYTHFTSPIRRYSDLVIHRLLFSAKQDPAYLQKIAERCSEKERSSSRAENAVLLLKKLRLLQANPSKKYEAYITKVKPFGIFFELSDLLVEGMIHISELGQDYYIWNSSKETLEGECSQELFHTGAKVFVRLKHIDLIHQESEWELSCLALTKRKKKRR